MLNHYSHYVQQLIKVSTFAIASTFMTQQSQVHLFSI